MKIGMTELLVVFIVALFVIGPEKLPYYAKKLGEALGQFKKYSDAAARDIRESIVEPLQEAQEPLREAMEPLEELDRAVRGNVKDVKDSLNDLGKVKKSGKMEEKSQPESEPAEMKEQKDPVLSEMKAEAEPEPVEMKIRMDENLEQHIAECDAEPEGVVEKREIPKPSEGQLKLGAEEMLKNPENISNPDTLQELEELQSRMEELQKRIEELKGKEESA